MSVYSVMIVDDDVEFGRFVNLEPSCIASVQPIGLFPTEGDIDRAMELAPASESPHAIVNQLRLLGEGDVLLLYTDGASERIDGEFADALTPTIRSVAPLSAREIVYALRDELDRLGAQKDDMTLVAIKRLR